MTIRELRNILLSYDQDLEFMIGTEESLWAVEAQSFREATVYDTSSGYLVDKDDYNEKRDGSIGDTHVVLMLDLELDE